MAITQKGRELARLIGRDGDPDALEAASLIARHARTYERIQEAWCSIEMSEHQTAREERREARIEARITALAESIGTRAVFGGDPRGYTVKLVCPDGRSNTWGMDGIGVKGS